MQIRYYFSGFNEEKGFSEELINSLKQDIIETKKFIFVPSDFTKREITKKCAKEIMNSFSKVGFNFHTVILLHEHMRKEEMQAQIEDANVVYLMGGNPNTELEILRNYELKDSISKTNAIIVGISAGAMCMSKYSLLFPVSEEYPEMDIRSGMNLSNISIYPHYNSHGKIPDTYIDRGEQTKKSDLLYASQVYGNFFLLPEDSEIREQNGILTCIGQNIIYVNKGDFQLVSGTIINEEE